MPCLGQDQHIADLLSSPTLPECNEENRALTFGVWGKEVSDVIVEERQASGAKVLRVSAEIQSAPDYAGFELNRAVAAIPQSSKNRVKVGHQEDTSGCIARKVLLKPKISRFASEPARSQSFK
jgi:hypothetical protein